MKTINFNNGHIGIKIDSLQQAILYRSLGHDICYGDGNTLYDEEASESDINDAIVSGFYGEVYADIPVDCGKVVPNAAVTMQAKYAAGQWLYTIRNNKIDKVKVQYVILVESEETDKNSRNLRLARFARMPEYTCWSYGDERFLESQLFETPEEAAQSLLKNFQE